jgi:hypothetical protein
MNYEEINSVCRILFAAIFLIKQFYSYKCFDFHWAHINSFEKKGIKTLLLLKFVTTVFVLFGFFTFINSIILYCLYFYTYWKSSSFGLEDVYFSIFSFYNIFANNYLYSIDNLFNLSIFNYSILINPLPEIILALLLSLTFFSAAIEKLNSKIWREGRGVYLFFVNPKCKKINTNLLTNNFNLMKILNYLMILSQLVLLFLLIFVPIKYLIINWVILFLFVIILIVFFQFAWLSECCLIILFVIGNLFFNYPELTVYKFLIEFYSNSHLIEKIILSSICFFCLLTLISLLFPVEYLKKDKSYYFTKFILHTKFFSRVIFGIIGIRAFTDVHIANPISFKIFNIQNEKEIELEKLYMENGKPSLKHTWYLPTVYLTSAYKIWDILIQLDNNNEIKKSNELYLVGFLNFILKKKNFKKNREVFILKINQLHINREFTKDLEIELSKKTTEKILKIIITNQNKIEFVKLRTPLLKFKSGRKQNRENFYPNKEIVI